MYARPPASDLADRSKSPSAIFVITAARPKMVCSWIAAARACKDTIVVSMSCENASVL